MYIYIYTLYRRFTQNISNEIRQDRLLLELTLLHELTRPRFKKKNDLAIAASNRGAL